MMKGKIFFLAATFCLTWQYAVAATGTSTGTANLSELTIADGGNGLGSGPPEGGETYMWADYENGTTNASSLGQVDFDDNENLAINSESGIFTNSSRHVKGTFDASPEVGSLTRSLSVSVTTVVIFTSRYFTQAPNVCQNQKTFRINRDAGSWSFVASSVDNGVVLNECNNFDPYHAHDMPASVQLDQWYTFDHGSDYRADCNSGPGDGKTSLLQNGTTLFYLTDRCGCANTGDRIQVMDNFVDAAHLAEVDGQSVYMDNQFVSLSYWRVTVSSDNFLNQYPVITSSWNSGQIVGRMHTGRIANGAAIKYRVYGGQNQVLAQGDVTAGVGQTNLHPADSNLTSTSVTESWDDFGTTYTKVLDNDSNFSSPISSVTETTANKSYSGLAPSTLHYFQVKIGSESAYSSQDTFTTSAAAAGGTSPSKRLSGNGRRGGGGRK